jgi:hypothetical protein
MAEHYYRYKSDDAPINLDDDEIYDYVLEREALKDLDNMPPRCMATFGKDHEHFGNLKGGYTALLKNMTLAVVVIIVLYLVYSLLCEKNGSVSLKPGNYIVRLNQ